MVKESFVPMVAQKKGYRPLDKKNYFSSLFSQSNKKN
jgi:hypothetical protein